jgi:hypothetical protein
MKFLNKSLFDERLAWFALLIILFATGIIRYGLLDVPLERDEGEYAYAGQLILKGIPPYQVSRSIYGLSPFYESLKIADFIKKNTNPEDRIAILGSEPQIFFWRSASSYIYMYPLMENHDFIFQMQKDFINDIKQGIQNLSFSSIFHLHGHVAAIHTTLFLHGSLIINKKTIG